MRQLAINIAVVVTALVIAIVLGAGVQEAFRQFLPALSSQSVGDTDVGTYMGIVAMTIALFAYGYVAPRWLGASYQLAWLLVPVALLYIAAMVATPQFFLYSARFPFFWAAMHLTFILPLLASALGYMAQRSEAI